MDNGNLDLIGTRIPSYIVPDWIAYCTARKLTQSEVIRRAISQFIERDDTATDAELVVAATIADGARTYSLRSEGEDFPRPRRWRGSLA